MAILMREKISTGSVKIVGAFFIAAMQWGCASTEGMGGSDNLAAQPAVDQLLVAENSPGGIAAIRPPMEAAGAKGDQLLWVSPAMRKFVAGISPNSSPNARFRAILRTLKRENFYMEHDLSHTTSAAEVFQSRRGNCISFSAMIVALAREVGVEAHFNFVEAPTARRVTDSRGNPLVQNILHINAEVSFDWTTRIIESNFEPRGPYKHIPITDKQVVLFYLNNLAIEAAHQNNLDQAFAHINEAMALNANSSLLWTTRGYLQRRAGQLTLAELSYSRAIELDENNVSAWHNRRLVYEQINRRALSRTEGALKDEKQGS
ncbi:hypothetical protein M0G74_04410 [Microbulbifer sp. CAU 1566]|uniref:transglutaminase domain-containing protein n=1 Tax=Microbulbifer sp. CAU 1566 TaxID=2933269 RepID=UPI002004F942|nr:hypothetical protein [Microbulbifer sp. CAU 1566]